MRLRVRREGDGEALVINPNPSGLCMCGCGVPTRIATFTDRSGVKGFPRKFLRHHNPRKAITLDYRVDHKATRQRGKKMRLHVVRAEMALGKALPSTAIVHHADGSKSDDAPLVICQDQAYHLLLHSRMRIKAAGGNPNTDSICSCCRLAKPRSAFSRHSITTTGVDRYCRECKSAKDLVWRPRKRST